MVTPVKKGARQCTILGVQQVLWLGLQATILGWPLHYSHTQGSARSRFAPNDDLGLPQMTTAHRTEPRPCLLIAWWSIKGTILLFTRKPSRPSYINRIASAVNSYRAPTLAAPNNLQYQTSLTAYPADLQLCSYRTHLARMCRSPTRCKSASSK